MSKSSPLSHLDAQGESRMVNVGEKGKTERIAIAEATVFFPDQAAGLVYEGQGPKGSIQEVVKVAGIQAAKRTSDLIPMCHPLALDHIEIQLHLDEVESTISIQCRCQVEAKTGVEMEAMVGASVAALTLYDMTKSLNKGISIQETRLLLKSGGKSGEWTAQ
jgi:cyclic pyranopterin phosphate synthase